MKTYTPLFRFATVWVSVKSFLLSLKARWINLKTRFAERLFFLFVLFSPLFVVTVSEASIELSLIPYPLAREVFESESQVEDYWLTLGSLKKANSEWRAEVEQRVTGQIHRLTLEITGGISPDEAFEHYFDQLDRANARVLFQCQGRACGSSNSWANNRFKIKQLYGSDQHQRYAAFETVGTKQQQLYVVLYSVMRGNKRVYVQIDTLKPDENRLGEIPASKEEVGRQLEKYGYYGLPGIQLKKDTIAVEPKHLKPLVSTLLKNRQLTVAVVTHVYEPESLEKQKSLSKQYANQIRQQLVSNGINKERVKAFGLGGLAPVRTEQNRTPRVEIVTIVP